MAAHARVRIIAAVVVVTAGVLAWRFWPRRPAEPAGTIKVSGTVEATEIQVGPKIGGRLVALTVDEGQAVTRGQLLARLDTAELTAQTRQAAASVGAAQAKADAAVNGSRPEQIAQARAQLAQAEANVVGARNAVANARKGFRRVTELKAQLDAARAKLEAAEAAQRQAEETLRLVRSGPRDQQVRQARAAVEQADASLDRAERDLRRMRALYAAGATSAQQSEAAGTSRDVARTQVDQAKAHLADLLAGARPEEIHQAEAALAQARANREGAVLALRNAQEAYDDRLSFQSQLDAANAGYRAAQATQRAAQAQLDLLLAGSRAEDIRAAQEQVKQARASQALAGAQYHNAFVYSPANGIIKTKVSENGETVGAGTPVVTINDLDHAWVRVYIPENLYGRVKLGQEAEIAADSYPGQRFKGKVVEIASEAEFTPKNVQTDEERVKLVYGVKIDLDNRDHRLKPGMPVDAYLRVR